MIQSIPNASIESAHVMTTTLDSLAIDARDGLIYTSFEMYQVTQPKNIEMIRQLIDVTSSTPCKLNLKTLPQNEFED